MREIFVDLADHSYRIHIAAGILSSCADCQEFHEIHHGLILTDENVAGHYLQPLIGQLSVRGVQCNAMVVPPGENSKSIESLSGVWNWIDETRATRQSTIIALGGGVVGDLAGFAAATFARGIPLVQVPTSLLAQVDSSVGGKTGINLPTAKNRVGAFWQPRLVLIDPTTLNTLVDREFIAGLAEVVKYGVVADAEFFQRLESKTELIGRRDLDELEHIIATCCSLKARIVESDERETSGQRAVLNYGHTIGHAIEACYGYQRYLHGEAVSLGMVMAAQLARQLDRVDDEFCIRQTELLKCLGLPVALPDADVQRLLELMKSDKKRDETGLRFVLPTRLGHVELVSSIDPAMVGDAIKQCGHDG